MTFDPGRPGGAVVQSPRERPLPATPGPVPAIDPAPRELAVSARIVILGGGTGGTLTANRLRKALPADTHDHRRRRGRPPRLPAGPAVRAVRPGRTRRTSSGLARRQLHHGIDVPPVRRRPRRRRGRRGPPRRRRPMLDYDVLVVATGCRLVPEETEGLHRAGLDARRVHLLRPRGRRRPRSARSADFDGGRLVVNVVDMPIKCPVAPLEFCFLADWYFHERGIRDDVEHHLRHPARRCVHQADRVAGARRDARGARHRAGDRVQHRRGRRRRPAASSPTTSARSRSTSPSSSPCTAARRTSAGHPGSATTSTSSPPTRTRCSPRAKPNIFAIGDAASLPISKAGSVTHFEGEVLVENIAAVPRRRAARRLLRRPRQLLHRDRLPQGDAHRLQLRPGARRRPLPDVGRRCRCSRSPGSTTSAS